MAKWNRLKTTIIAIAVSITTITTFLTTQTEAITNLAISWGLISPEEPSSEKSAGQTINNTGTINGNITNIGGNYIDQNSDKE